MSRVTASRAAAPRDVSPLNLKALVGSGDRIMLFTLPFLLVGLLLNALFPAVFDVAGPPTAVWAAAVVVLAAGVAIWAWSAVLILVNVPRRQLITTGPFAVMKHPLYTGIALLVLPSLGVLLNTWLGAAVGCVMYIGSRLYAPAEEARMATMFGAEWERYRRAVTLPWL